MTPPKFEREFEQMIDAALDFYRESRDEAEIVEIPEDEDSPTVGERG